MDRECGHGGTLIRSRSNSAYLHAQLLLQCLHEIPVVDPTSLWIPQDPFDTLKHRFKFSDLSALEERWQTNPHALTLVKDSLVSIPGRSRSDKAPLFDDCESGYGLTTRP